MMDFEKEDVFILTEVATAIPELKSKKLSDEDDIRPEMLNTLNGEDVRWLIRVCQVACNLE